MGLSFLNNFFGCSTTPKLHFTNHGFAWLMASQSKSLRHVESSTSDVSTVCGDVKLILVTFYTMMWRKPLISSMYLLINMTCHQTSRKWLDQRRAQHSLFCSSVPMFWFQNCRLCLFNGLLNPGQMVQPITEPMYCILAMNVCSHIPCQCKHSKLGSRHMIQDSETIQYYSNLNPHTQFNENQGNK